jgi:hypothetical protein
VAVPSAVAKLNVTAWPLAAERLIWKIKLVWPELPSLSVTSPTLNEGVASSSVMVTVACDCAPMRTLPLPTESASVNDSSGSSSASFVTLTVKFFVASPARNVTEPVPPE